MPTLQRFGPVGARMYADDRRPARFPIVAPDFLEHVVFRLK
jgi:hypothetical protein